MKPAPTGSETRRKTTGRSPDKGRNAVNAAVVIRHDQVWTGLRQLSGIFAQTCRVRGQPAVIDLEIATITPA